MATQGHKDQNGNAWVITDNAAGVFVAAPSQPAFGVPAGRKLVVSDSLDNTKDAIANLVDEYNETGKLVMRGDGVVITAAADAIRNATKKTNAGWGPIIGVVLLLFVLTDKGRR